MGIVIRLVSQLCSEPRIRLDGEQMAHRRLQYRRRRVACACANLEADAVRIEGRTLAYPVEQFRRVGWTRIVVEIRVLAEFRTAGGEWMDATCQGAKLERAVSAQRLFLNSTM